MKIKLQHDSFALILGTLALFAIGLVQDGIHRVTTEEAYSVTPPPEYFGLSMDPQIMRRFLGLRLVAADLVWIDTLAKADILRGREVFKGFYYAFKQIVTLDPDNLYAYYVAGVYLSVIKDDPQAATSILREGVHYMESHPYSWDQAWRVPFALGYNLMFEEQDFEEGASWIRKAGEWNGAPPLIRALSSRVSTPQGRLEVGSRILLEARRHLTNPSDIARIEKKMIDIAEKQELFDLNDKFQRYLSTTEAYALPKQKAFKLFMRSGGYPMKNLLGQPLFLDDLGKISIQRKQ